MKKIALISAALVITSAAFANAATVNSIKDSRHDMRKLNGAPTNSTTEEICIYCHTPHNAGTPIPLWNRNNASTGGWKLYNTSNTLTTAAKNSSITTDSISFLCMSCHDGITAVGDVINKNPLTNQYATSNQTWGYGLAGNGAANKVPEGYARIGGNGASGGRDLSNTHPIGFDFYAAANEDNGIHTDTYIMNEFATDSVKSTRQNFLYVRGNAGTAKWFECASCHRVHDPGPSGNFLRLENGASKLCLACHDK